MNRPRDARRLLRFATAFFALLTVVVVAVMIWSAWASLSGQLNDAKHERARLLVEVNEFKRENAGLRAKVQELNDSVAGLREQLLAAGIQPVDSTPPASAPPAGTSQQQTAPPSTPTPTTATPSTPQTIPEPAPPAPPTTRCVVPGVTLVGCR